MTQAPAPGWHWQQGWLSPPRSQMPPSLKNKPFSSSNWNFHHRAVWVKEIFVCTEIQQRLCGPAQKAMCSPSASLPFSWAAKDLIISRCDYRNWSLYSTNRLHANSKCSRKVFKYSPAPGKIPKTSGFPKLCFCRHLYLHQLTSSCESFGVILYSEQLKFVCWTSVM